MRSRREWAHFARYYVERLYVTASCDDEFKCSGAYDKYPSEYISVYTILVAFNESTDKPTKLSTR